MSESESRRFPNAPLTVDAQIRRAEIAEAAAAPQWISVAERLPEAGAEVLVSLDYGVGIGYWEPALEWHERYGEGYMPCKPTHWMVLPDPPEPPK